MEAGLRNAAVGRRKESRAAWRGKKEAKQGMQTSDGMGFPAQRRVIKACRPFLGKHRSTSEQLYHAIKQWAESQPNVKPYKPIP